MSVTVDGRQRRRVGRTVFIIVVVLFAVVNVYRSTTLSWSPASSHEFSYRQQLRHLPPSAADNRQGNGNYSLTDRSTAYPEVDRLLLVRSVREDDFPAYNVTMDTGGVRAVPLWQRRLNRRRRNSSANAALEDDIIGPCYFLTELLQVSVDNIIHLAFITTAEVMLMIRLKCPYSKEWTRSRENQSVRTQGWQEGNGWHKNQFQKVVMKQRSSKLCEIVLLAGIPV